MPSILKYFGLVAATLIVSFALATDAQMQVQSTESSPVQDIDLRNVSNIQFKASRDTTSSLFSSIRSSSLSSSDASSYRMFASLYNHLEHAPFGPTIDISFETMGEAFDFKGLKLSSSTTNIVFVGENDEETRATLPATTYTSSFIDSDGIANTVVATINPLDNEYMVHVMRENKPALVLQPFTFFKRGSTNQPAIAAKLAAMSPSSHISFYSDEVEMSGPDGASPCGVDSRHSNTEVNSDGSSTVLASNSSENSDDAVSRSLKALIPFNNCHGKGDRLFALNSGIVVDYSALTYHGNVASYNAFLQQAYKTNSLVYETQFKIQLRLQEIRVITTDSTETMEWNVGCQNMNSQLGLFREWTKTKGLSSRYGAWELHTICPTEQYDAVGIAYLNTLCSESAVSVSKVYSGSGMQTIAHELGHNFGSDHAWEYPKTPKKKPGTIGGIMDYYTNGKLLANHPVSPNEYGFHETSEEPVCLKLKSLLSIENNLGLSNACFSEVSQDAEPMCGNGIIEHGEECEVSTTERPGSSSTCCQNCKLVKGATCSLDNECCENCQAQTPSTKCELPNNTSTDGVCGYGISTGCSQFYVNPCIGPVLKACMIECDGGTRRGYAPDGTVCVAEKAGSSTAGICMKNVCVASSYEWNLSLGAQCDCSLPTENVFRQHSYYCVEQTRKTIAATDKCSGIPIPVDKETFDCTLICHGEASPDTSEGSASFAISSSLSHVITVISIFALVVSLTL